MGKKTFDVVEGVLAANVANGATFKASYPPGRRQHDYISGRDHIVATSNYGELKALAGSIAVAFGAADVTVTNNSGLTLAAGTRYFLQLDRLGFDGPGRPVAADEIRMTPLSSYHINLGAPATADPDGVSKTQAVTVGTTPLAVLDGDLVNADGEAVFDVPRNVVAAWTGAAVLTVTGKDAYGNTVVESSALGTALAGKKAFKSVSKVSLSADVTALTVGNGDVLGLPVFLPGAGFVVRELQDGAPAAAGTVTPAADTAATATTGDVRGTYDPSAACDGAKAFALVAMLAEPQYRGRDQYAG